MLKYLSWSLYLCKGAIRGQCVCLTEFEQVQLKSNSRSYMSQVRRRDIVSEEGMSLSRAAMTRVVSSFHLAGLRL